MVVLPPQRLDQSLLVSVDTSYQLEKKPERLFSPGSFLSTTLLLVVAALGAGALSLPYAMLGSGLLVGILCFVICACIAVTSNLILFTAVTKTGLHTYGAVVDWALVRLGFKKADLLAAVGQQAEGNAPYYSISPLGVSPRLAFFELWAFVYCVMTCVSYLVFLGDFIPSITGYYLQGIDPEVFRKFCIVACAYLAIYPMSVSKSISVLRYVSSLSIWAVVLTATVVLIRAPSLVEEHPEEARASLSLSESHVNMSTFNTFAVCMFGLMNQIPAVRVAAEMSRPTTVRRTIANVVAGVALSSIYLSMAIAVYLSFLTDTKPNFMQNYAADDRIIFVCRIGLTIMLLVAAPMNLLPGLAGFYKALELGAGEGSVGDVPVRNPFFVFCRWIESVVGVQSLLMQYGAPFFSITVCTAIALLVPNVASFIGSMSSYLAAPLVCGFPGLVYAALQKDDDIGKKRWPLLTIALVFITLLLWVTATINIFFS